MALKHHYLALIGTAALMLAAPVSYANTTSTIDERLSKLERIINARSKAQVDLAQHIETLQDEINELRGISEEHNYKLGQILDRQRELYQEIENRLSAAMQATQETAAIVQQAPLANPNDISNTDVQITDDLSENEAYDRAVNMVLKDKLYEQAIPEFESFITQYPLSVYQPNAHYWLGQLLFNKGSLDKAAEHFNIVLEQYPDSNKRCDAMLKLGMVAQKQSDVALATERFQNVLTECPDTSPARLAKNRLSAL